MSATPPKSPADVGKLARLLAQSGDVSTAVTLVRNNISGGITGNAGDYADQVAVLNQAGLTNEAQTLLSNPQLQAGSTPTQLASIRNGYVINEADRLREQGNYAAAYDKLMGAMQSDPQNTDLMFAMARLYQSGKMNKEAGVVYDYLMTRDTPDQAARSGAIDVALSSGDNDRAEQLAGGLRQDNTTGSPAAAGARRGSAGTPSAGDDVSAQRARQTAGAAEQQQRTNAHRWRRAGGG
ncbi:cellulose synthase subunit BcsC [Raoultella ornithinolytica]|nr:cellulose synthase subunit BcsC [Raoultella ornithinolytica]